MIELFSAFRHAAFVKKRLVPISADTGNIVSTKEEYHLLYFGKQNRLLDMDLSVFEETGSGMLMPVKFVLSSGAKRYDVAELEMAVIGDKMETCIGGSILISSAVKRAIDTYSFKLLGVKSVPLDEALYHYCRDRSCDIDTLFRRKQKKPKLP
jgi:hypothetical protein